MKTITVSFSKECIPYHKEMVREFLKGTHTYQYDETTRIVDLFRYLWDKSGFTAEDESDEEWDSSENYNEQIEFADDEILRFFVILHDNDYYSLWNPNVYIDPLFTYLGIQDKVELYFETSFGGEGSFNEVECEGIQFYFHSDETVHWGRPHIHAKVDENQISIDLNTFEIIVGRFEKRKQEKEAVECVKTHQRTFMKGWNDHSNGIRVNLNKYSDLVSNEL